MNKILNEDCRNEIFIDKSITKKSGETSIQAECFYNRIFLQGGARKAFEIEGYKDSNKKIIKTFYIDQHIYSLIKALCESMGLHVNRDKQKRIIKISGVYPHYRSDKQDYDIIPITIEMQTGVEKCNPNDTGRTIYSGRGYIDPFGVGSYVAGIDYAEVVEYPMDQYFSKWWMENFDSKLFCIYNFKDGDIYAWSGKIGRVSNDMTDGTVNREDALVNIIVGGTGHYKGTTGIMVGSMHSAGIRDKNTNLQKAFIKVMKGYIKLPKKHDADIVPEVTQYIGKYTSIKEKLDTKKYKTIEIKVIMSAGVHERDVWKNGYWTFHNGSGLVKPFGKSRYHAGIRYPEAEKLPNEKFFNENWLREFDTLLFCIYHIGDLGDIYVYDGMFGKMLEEDKNLMQKPGTLAQRKDALVNIIVGGTRAFEKATGILVGQSMGAGKNIQCGFMPKEFVCEDESQEDKVPYVLPETLIKIMDGYIRVPADSKAIAYTHY